VDVFAGVRSLRRIAMALGIGRQTADSVEGGSIATVQIVLAGDEMLGDVYLMQQSGVASRPRPGADHIVVLQQGDRGRAISIASNDQNSRPRTLDVGDVQIFHPVIGSYIWLRSSGDIDIVPKSGTVNVAGSLKATGDVVAGAISLTNHLHGGVQTGEGKTGVPVAS